MRCPKCLKISPKEYDRCAYCGAKFLRETSREAINNQILISCPHCQSKIPKGSGYCRVCGKRLTDEESILTSELNKSEKNTTDIQNQEMTKENDQISGPDFDKGKTPFTNKDSKVESSNNKELFDEITYKDDSGHKTLVYPDSTNKQSLATVTIIVGVIIVLAIILFNNPDLTGSGSSPNSDNNSDYSDDSYTDDSDYSDDSYSDDVDIFPVDYSKVLDLSNYEYIEDEDFSFYAPTSLYDTVEVDDAQNYYWYSSNYSEGDDYISFGATPYGKYDYSFDTPDELLDILCEDYPQDEQNILLKQYQSESSDGIGRLVYYVPDENYYCALSFYDDKVYEMDIGHRDPESEEEARWMDYYINVLYRGCSFTRDVGHMYTYEEYLEDN